MKKLVKKIVVAVMAMAMAIGMLAVSASADSKDATGTTDWKIKGAWDGWATETAMTSDGNGKFYADVEVKAGDFEFVIWGTVDGAETYVKADGYDYNPNNNLLLTASEDGKVRIVLDPSKITERYFGGTYYLYRDNGVTLEEVPVSVPTGDATPYIAIAAVAVLALGAVVILASKKKVVTE